jgi:hypothetical protein
MLRRWWLSVGCFVAALGCQTSDTGLGRPSSARNTGGSGGMATGGRGGRGGTMGSGGTTGSGGMATVDADVPERAPIEVAPEVRVEPASSPDMAPPAPDVPRAMPWKPGLGLTWDWQMTGAVTPANNVDVYDIDLYANGPEVIADLHTRGKKVICHLDLGTWEAGRPDADRFPVQSVGNKYKGNPDKLWVDIRNYTGLTPIIRGRLDLAMQKGCDAVAPDNLDAWDLKAHEDPGFPLTGMDQLVYNRIIATEAHQRGLAVGLRNDNRQVLDLVAAFDFHVSDQCYTRKDCPELLPFISAGKPVFDVEYTLTVAQFCAMAKTQKISAMKKRPTLDSFREACPP